MRFLNATLVALLLTSAAGAVSRATGLSDYLEGEQSLSIADSRVMADLATYYRLHANVRLGPERRLANGVAWRLLTDIRTGVKSPRITWMPDRESMLKANALFDVVQWAALVDYDKLDLQRRTAELYDWSFGGPPDVIKPPYFYPEKVAVTYATSKFVSYVELRREVRHISMGVEVYGRVLDLERGRIREIEGCEAPQYTYLKTFRFGELLDVCDDEIYDRFIALWAGKVRHAIAAARARDDELSVQCGESMEEVDWTEGGRRLGLYLTPAGVAVFNVHWWRPNSAKFCAFYDNITVNPIIIPYRELEPFMKPGPWRDDVLNQSRATLR
jgi:hypothetical protein